MVPNVSMRTSEQQGGGRLPPLHRCHQNLEVLFFHLVTFVRVFYFCWVSQQWQVWW